ncbi:hypothetical protein CsSME_00052705 [Camellia sinensis var. sinensis]
MKTVQESLSTTSLDQSMIGRGRRNQASVVGRPLILDGRLPFVVGRPPLLACRPPLQNQANSGFFGWKSMHIHEHSSLPEAILV